MIADRFPAPLGDTGMNLIRMRVSTSIMNAVVRLEGRVDTVRLHRAVRLAMDAEPILGCRYVVEQGHPYWRRRADLDDLALCQVVEVDDAEPALSQFLVDSLDPAREPLLRIVVFRGERDTVCIKMTHTIADGRAYLQVLNLLAGLYRRLKDEPDYVPPVHHADRLLQRAIARHFTFRQRLQLLAKLIKGQMSAKSAFVLGDTQSGDAGCGYLMLKLPPRRSAALLEHGRTHGSTITALILAATCRAARGLFPLEGTGPIDFYTTFDMRRYLPDDLRYTPVSNISGAKQLKIDVSEGQTFDAMASAIYQQLTTATKDPTAISGAHALFFAVPVLASCLNAIPLSFVRPRVVKLTRRIRSRRQLQWVLGSVGTLPGAAIDFGQPVDDAFFTGSIYFAPGISLALYTFAETLTLCVGTCNRVIDPKLVRELFERIERELPCGEQGAGAIVAYSARTPADALSELQETALAAV